MAPSPEDPDQADIAASLAGSEAAFARLMQRHQPAIALQMWRYTRDPDTAAALVQEVFTEAYVSLGGYRARAPFIHWLRRIATRTGLRHWKRQARERPFAHPLPEGPGEPAMPPAPEPSEAAEYLFHLLARLPADDRMVLTLHYFEELGMREIADQLGWSLSRTKVRAHRARARLRQMLEEAGYENP